MNRLKYTPDPTQGDAPLVLQKNEVFVFGANKLGLHLGGAAYAAHKFYGAEMKKIHRTGNSYGIVTVNTPGPDKVTVEELEQEIELFFAQTRKEPEKTFYLTRIGTGIGGWKEEEVVPIIKKIYESKDHKNVVFPKNFVLVHELGPLQKFWIEQLKAHPEKQTISVLAKGTSKKYEACCLGEGLLCYYRMKHKKFPFDPESDLLKSERSYRCLNEYEKLGLRDRVGRLRYGIADQISLAGLNDHGWSWVEIAEYIEENPENVFEKAV